MDNSKEFQIMLNEAIKIEPSAFKNFDRTKNVQDQLQEMVKLSTEPAIIQLHRFKEWAYIQREDLIAELKTFEQLWLAFVMYEKYGKVWDDKKEEWVESKGRLVE